MKAGKDKGMEGRERASEAIGQRETKEQWFTDVVRQRALSPVTLEQVRDDLATITGSLSDVVSQLRQERG
jgi:hypothetical protein